MTTAINPPTDADRVRAFIIWAGGLVSIPESTITPITHEHRQAIIAAAGELSSTYEGRSKGGRQLTDAKRQQLKDAASKPRPKRKQSKSVVK